MECRQGHAAFLKFYDWLDRSVASETCKFMPVTKFGGFQSSFVQVSVPWRCPAPVWGCQRHTRRSSDPELDILHVLRVVSAASNSAGACWAIVSDLGECVCLSSEIPAACASSHAVLSAHGAQPLSCSCSAGLRTLPSRVVRSGLDSSHVTPSQNLWRMQVFVLAGGQPGLGRASKTTLCLTVCVQRHGAICFTFVYGVSLRLGSAPAQNRGAP